MLKTRLLLFLSVMTLFWSCKTDKKYNYAIKDFRSSLQPHLTKMVEKGIVMYSDSALRNMATDEELERLGESEHPILRAAAFREMLKRKSFKHFDIIIKHLDDTALVFTDAGEFGIWDRTVSDDILQEADWKTQSEKSKTVDIVLTKHNYLRSAYIILPRLEPQEKYYQFVKSMATRPRWLDPDEGYELGFGDIEYALYGLAKFKKKEDVEVIKQSLLEYVGRLSDISFQFMSEFPDTAYFDVLQAYHRRQFYRFSSNRPVGFTGYAADRAAPEDFIKALVVQQTDRSAKLLDTILNRLPLQTSMPDKEYIFNNIITEIWEHPCPAYVKLREKIKPKAEEILKGKISLPLDSSHQLDNTATKIRWRD